MMVRSNRGLKEIVLQMGTKKVWRMPKQLDPNECGEANHTRARNTEAARLG
jgi:hypothetical protein